MLHIYELTRLIVNRPLKALQCFVLYVLHVHTVILTAVKEDIRGTNHGQLLLIPVAVILNWNGYLKPHFCTFL